jgi:hypothetical protein
MLFYMIESFNTPFESKEKEKKKFSKEYFDIQLSFARVYSGKAKIPFAHALFTHTNFFRRFGLGQPKEANESDDRWQEYVQGLDGKDESEILDYTFNFYQEAKDEQEPSSDRIFGCFSFDPIAESDGVVFLHFSNRDQDGSSPLAKDKRFLRHEELKKMFLHIKQNYPYARMVKSGSWLQGLDSYQSLFPSEYNSSMRLIRPNKKFQGQSRWGQFLKHDGEVREDLKKKFLEKLKDMDVERPEEVFPLSTYATESPIEHFYKYFEI